MKKMTGFLLAMGLEFPIEGAAEQCPCGRMVVTDKTGEMQFHDDGSPFTEECENNENA